MQEHHPFGLWTPAEVTYLILGSFPGVGSCKDSPHYDSTYDWFYRSKRGRFWHMLEAVYGVPLKSKEAQIELMTRLRMAMGDVILSCRRKDGTNADTNLTDIIYNKEAIASFLDTHNIQTIFFTSRFAADRFNRYFKEVRTAHPEVTLVTLPSPSPRYARMQEDEKIARYRILLPH